MSITEPCDHLAERHLKDLVVQDCAQLRESAEGNSLIPLCSRLEACLHRALTQVSLLLTVLISPSHSGSC